METEFNFGKGKYYKIIKINQNLKPFLGEYHDRLTLDSSCLAKKNRNKLYVCYILVYLSTKVGLCLRNATFEHPRKYMYTFPAKGRERGKEKRGENTAMNLAFRF